MTALDPSHLAARFPGVHDGWARFDGPGGTQMVGRAIEAMRTEMSDGLSANMGGAFTASRATDELVGDARSVVGRFIGADPAGVVFGPNMTSLTFAFTRALARTLGGGDEIVCTRLDHDANVSPWLLAAADRGATVVLADIDPVTGRLPVEHVTARIGERTRWVAVTGASNLIGTIPDVTAITGAAHEAGARVYVDAVHLVPHRAVDVAAIGCDAFVCSPYKWYGPHAGVLCLTPELLEEIEPYKVRPAPDTGPRRLETGTPSFEAIAGSRAAAEFLMDVGMDALAHAESAVFQPLLEGLLSLDHVTVHGPTTMDDRTPTVLFSVARKTPADVAARLAEARIAVWAGHNYAIETVAALGLDRAGGAVRAGVSLYTSPEDVSRLLGAVAALA